VGLEAERRWGPQHQGVTIDDAANRLLGNALRTPLSTGSLQTTTRTRPVAQSYEYDDSDSSEDSQGQDDHDNQDDQSRPVETRTPAAPVKLDGSESPACARIAVGFGLTSGSCKGPKRIDC
jgi:hypothetical protein